MDAAALSPYTIMAAFAAAVGLMIVQTTRRQRHHAHLRQQLGGLRLSKMLPYLGADVDEYLRAVPSEDLKEEMHRCGRCLAHATCDACVHEGRLVSDMHFCPVYPSLIRHSQTVAARRRW